MNSKKKDEKELDTSSRRQFVEKGGMALMGGMFAWTNVSAEDLGSAPDQPIAAMLKIKVSGSAVANKLTPQDMMAIASPLSKAGKSRIASRSYLKEVSFKDVGALNNALSGKFGNGPIIMGADDSDGDVIIIPCCCCCCC